jgi:hypothetical protein
VLGDSLGGYGSDFSPWFTAKLVANQMGVDLLLPGLAHRIDLFVPKLYELPDVQVAVLIAAGLAGIVGLVLLARWAGLRLGGADARLLGFALAGVVQYAALFAFTGFYERRFLYAATAFFSFVTSWALLWGVDFAGRLLRGAPAGRRVAFAFRGTCLFLLLIWIGLHLAQSPLLHRYDEWRSSGETTRLLTEGLRARWGELPDEARVLVANLPSGFSYEPMRFVMYLRRSSTNSPPTKALAAWLEDQLPGKRIVLTALGYHRYEAPVSEFRHRMRTRGNRVEFDAPAGSVEIVKPAEDLAGLRIDLLGGHRLAITATGRSPASDLFLLVFDGHEPRFVPLGNRGPVPSAHP